MKNCTQCGIQIPNNQRICSMCYGDIDYGSDGNYQRWAERERQREEEQEER